MLKYVELSTKKTERELYCEDISKGIHRMVDIQPFMAAVQTFVLGSPRPCVIHKQDFQCLWRQ